MKKFLSLVLALVMAMSLVTISAGATEYKDLTDKDEIQYEEAVAVLNRIGIITGYSDGSFRPTDELTRGAAAKIIVSLLIGSEAAENLTATTAPFNDVPVDYTFAGVIAFCKSENIISGYGDGSFQPGGNLTGYAFSKMLLGALGYDADLEGFNGAGWSMKVASLGNAAGLFNRLDFYGTETVNREEACQLALNTLKATMVEYTGGFNVVAGDATIVGNQVRTYVTSNQEYARHISEQRAGGNNNISSNALDTHYTVEFGEEHFKDLRMEAERDKTDDFGRPSNVWSYKKITIGTYPVEPDFVYTTQVEHNVDTVSDATKVRSLGLGSYKVNDEDTTVVYVNGVKQSGISKVAEISDYTDNGTVVEVYVSESNADFIETVVVVKTQLMEIKRVGADYVSLDLYGDNSDAKGNAKAGETVTAVKDGKELTGVLYGYNQAPIDVDVNNVEVDDECYEALSALKAGDIVAVVPVSEDGVGKYDVARVYVPETVTGSLDRVDTFGTVSKGPNATSVTVGGTEYDIALWNKDLYDINGDTIKVTTNDVRLYLDEFGNALYAEDVGATTNFLVIGNYRQGLVNGQIITYMNGWDINGDEISLNVGARDSLDGWRRNYPEGTLVRYTSNVTSNTAEWDVDYLGVFDVYTDRASTDTEDYQLKTSNTRIRLTDYVLSDSPNVDDETSRDHKITSRPAADSFTNVWTDGSIKFIYISADSDGEVDSIEFKSGMQAATNEELIGTGSKFDLTVAQACVSLKGNDDKVTTSSAIKAVVIKNDSSDASVNNLLYIARYKGMAGRTESGDIIYGYEVAMMNEKGGLDEDVTIYSTKNLSIGSFARYSKTATPETAGNISGLTDDNFYTLKAYTEVGRAASVIKATVAGYAVTAGDTQGQNKNLVFLDKDSLEGYSTTSLSNLLKDLQIDDTWATDRYLYDGDGGAACLVNMRNANFLDLTGNRIDSASEMFDFIADQAKEGKDITFRVALIFNDKVSHDDFRRAYTVILLNTTGAVETGGTTTPSTTDAVTFAAGLKAEEVGSIAAGSKVQVGSTGMTRVTFTLETPEWAYSGAVGGNLNAEISEYDIIDADTNQLIKRATKTLTIGQSSKDLNLVSGTTDFKTSGTLDISATNEFDDTLPQRSELEGKNIRIEIRKIEWKYAAVEYVGIQSADTFKDSAGTSDAPKYMAVGADNAASFAFKWTVSSAVGGTPTYTYEITGAQRKSGETVEMKAAATSGTAVNFTTGLYALGNQKVVVTMAATGAVIKFTPKIEGTADDGTTKKTYTVADIANDPVIDTSDGRNLGSITVSIRNNNQSENTITKGDTFWYVFETGACRNGSGAEDEIVTGYVVHAQIKRGDGEWEDIPVLNLEKNSGSDGSFELPVSNVESDVDFKIVSVDLVYSKSVPVNAEFTSPSQLVIEFNEAIALNVSGGSMINLGEVVATPSVDGKVLTLDFGTAIAGNGARNLVLASDVLTCGTSVVINFTYTPATNACSVNTVTTI